MKIYGHPLSTCTRKLLFALAEKGQSADFALVDLFEGAHEAPLHLKRHPFGVVPVLEDDTLVLYESRAILRYIDARFPAPPLVPDSPIDVARMNQWLSVDQSYIAPHTRTLAVERILKPREHREPDAAAERAALDALTRAFGVLDGALMGADYLAGPSLSLADISLSPYIASLAMLRAEHLLEKTPRLRSWWDRVSARDAWRKAVGVS